MNPEVLPIITEAEACEITAQLRLGPEPAKSQKQLAAKALSMKKRAPAAQPSPPPPPPAKGGGTDEIYEQILRDGDPPLGLRVLRFPELKPARASITPGSTWIGLSARGDSQLGCDSAPTRSAGWSTRSTTGSRRCRVGASATGGSSAPGSG